MDLDGPKLFALPDGGAFLEPVQCQVQLQMLDPKQVSSEEFL